MKLIAEAEKAHADQTKILKKYFLADKPFIGGAGHCGILFLNIIFYYSLQVEIVPALLT